MIRYSANMAYFENKVDTSKKIRISELITQRLIQYFSDRLWIVSLAQCGMLHLPPIIDTFIEKRGVYF